MTQVQTRAGVERSALTINHTIGTKVQTRAETLHLERTILDHPKHWSCFLSPLCVLSTPPKMCARSECVGECVGACVGVCVHILGVYDVL